MSKIRYLAIWSIHRNFAYAVDFYPEQEAEYRQCLKRSGDNVAGPYDTAEEARMVAETNLVNGFKNKQK